MTHRLRTLHDGIMVGIGTVLVDNPQLNGKQGSSWNANMIFSQFIQNMYLPSANVASINQPQPIVLDPFLRIPVDCKLITNYKNGIGKQLWLVVSKGGIERNCSKKETLIDIGVKLIIIDKIENGHIPLRNVLEHLKKEGIDKLMIEGGSKIIQSCLNSKTWDQLIITTGPIFIGSANGISAVTTNNDDDSNLPILKNVKYQIMGKDIVMAATQ
ncbi:riboflavin biosynthesis protein RibD domain-containing protein [Mycotypha africana]|uniref:riboflavin biosynthesis protein RibD domain-containing protein n=1 Tax=Mycotypha africana TaxID=64632 RepID=UPI0023011EE6|nr:riboflavin biosynthesis protein RibD domain-containing protein [Mycotypha africana]KAI8971771.1 riboflavin biosynthesis protein RibD domain-containing protein [Mycotypha africana]